MDGISFTKDGKKIVYFESNPLKGFKRLVLYNFDNEQAQSIEFSYKEVEFLNINESGEIFLFNNTSNNVMKYLPSTNVQRKYKLNSGVISRLIPTEEDVFVTENLQREITVSYTHLTLPTICSV